MMPDAPGPGARAARRILLVGMMGAGKTTVGRLLAQRLGWRYVDSDEQVESLTGHSVHELFESGGEEAFRPLESEALAAAVAGDDPVVVSVAGGAVLDPANRALVQRAGTVVWLRARPQTLLRRVTADAAAAGAAAVPAPRPDHRPLLAHDPAQVIEALERTRRPIYEEVADLVVDVDGVDPCAVVDHIESALR